MEDALRKAIEALKTKIDLARLERDAWKGRSVHNYAMASKLVKALEDELKDLGG
jgi:threonine aldolase